MLDNVRVNWNHTRRFVYDLESHAQTLVQTLVLSLVNIALYTRDGLGGGEYQKG